MEKSGSPLLPIKEEHLKPFREEVTTYLKSVAWSPDKRKTKSDQVDLSFLLHSKALGTNAEDELSILKNAVRISDDRILLSNTTNYVLNIIRDGFCIGKHLAQLYEKSSGLESLSNRNKQGTLHQSEMPEFHDKMEAQAALMTFAASYYIVWSLNSYRPEDVSAINIEFGGIPEVTFSRPTRAMQCTLYYYCAYLERSNVVNSDLELLKITLLYFERMIEEITLRKDSLKYTDYFTNNSYKLEHTDFVVQGFETSFTTTVHSIAFNSVKMEEIVANKEAKHMFKRFAERLLCHDLERGKNPMLELGGLPSITMGEGKPGTGKSMLIAATATLLKEKCEMLGIPFLFWPLPENIISTYQGGSAERALEWFKPMADPHKIIFAPIDDAENNLEERTRQGVSAGVREFIGVFLRNTEGAYAVNHGNRMISLFTNLPDQIDKAVLSRIQYRVAIDGAKSFEDFVDQDYLWWKKYEKLSPGFVKMKEPAGYQYMSAQKEITSLKEFYSTDYQFTQPKVEEVYKEVLKKNDPGEHSFFGIFFDNVQERYPFFSSRDLRNIQKAVDARIIDFDIPEEWWEKPDLFFRKDYDTKLNMLRELMKENMGELTFAQIRLREALFYIDTAVRINETGIEREIKQTATRIHINEEASKRLRNGQISLNS